jgi:hypothetical protein
MKKIIIIDSYSWKHFHEIGNASLLAECSYITNEIVYYSGKSAYNSLKNILDEKYYINNVYKNIPIIDIDNKIGSLLRFFLSAIVNCFLLLKVDKNAIIIYNYNNVFSLPLINILNKFLKKQLVILCHGEFEMFNQSIIQKHHFFWRLYFKIIKIYFVNKFIKISNRIIFLVLGDNIKCNLSKYVSANIYNKIYSIDRSYINKYYNRKINIDNSVLKIGFAGQVRKGKNISDIILLAKKLASEISCGKVELSITGSTIIMSKELTAVGIIIPYGKKLLSREEYDDKIAALDYVLFFYNSKMYKFTQSGPLIDALFLGKPVIALRNNYFEYIFNKYGNFGILVDTIDEMAELIRNIIKGYNLPFFDFNNIQNQLRPEKASLQLKTVLERVNFI